MTKYAPIALFVYKRFFHTKQTISALQKNKLSQYSDLFIFSDGPRTNAEFISVQKVREYLNTLSGFNNISIIERKSNYGLAKSIIEGVTQILNKFDKIIVMEDDLVVSPYFLDFMNDGLDLYRNENQVASIHGYTFPLKEEMPQSFFIRGADCWGWATWKRAWNIFEPDGRKLLTILRKEKMLPLFDYQGTQKYSRMLKDQISGKNNSWAIRWHASAFINNMLTLYPGKSLVSNIGMDNSGEHCQPISSLEVTVSQSPIHLKRILVSENSLARQSFIRYFKTMREPIAKKILNNIKKFISHERESHA